MTGFAARRGREGEMLARRYLEECGLVYIESNWRCKLGEIDLIFDDPSERVRVFVEVRWRSRGEWGEGSETVAWHKQQKLRRAAQVYQQQREYWGALRFDVVMIGTGADGAPALTHIPHAFM